MKKITIALLLGILLLSFGSCANKDQEYSYTIKDALKISTWVFDESVEGNIYDEDDSVYAFERLKLNEVKLMMPMDGMDMLQLNIFFEFEGIIEIVSETEDMNLSVNKNFTPLYINESDDCGRTYGYSVKFATQGFVSTYILIGECIGKDHSGSRGTRFAFDTNSEVGTERYLNVNAYRFDDEKNPIIRAQLKLVLIEDKIQKQLGNDNLSWRCYSIELISYEYSDVYIILDELWDDDDGE